MDPDRLELYVEGRRDRVFLQWILKGNQSKHALIKEIAFVDLPGVVGGERGRLIAFASAVEGKTQRLLFFADADYDRLLGRSLPGNVILTDGRDLEGYILREDCMEKVIALGLTSDTIPADKVLNQALMVGKRLAHIRLLSEINNLRLAFQATNLKKHLVWEKDGSLSFSLKTYLSALLSNSQRSLTQTDYILSEVQNLEMRFKETPILELIHGKDFMEILDKFLDHATKDARITSDTIWMTFERSHVLFYQALQKIYNLLLAEAHPST
jgi:hypothetical protein